MSQAHIAHNRFELELDGDERQRRIQQFVANLCKPGSGSSYARPDANGAIEEEIAQDLRNAAGYSVIEGLLHEAGVEAVEFENTLVQKH